MRTPMSSSEKRGSSHRAVRLPLPALLSLSHLHCPGCQPAINSKQLNLFTYLLSCHWQVHLTKCQQCGFYLCEGRYAAIVPLLLLLTALLPLLSAGKKSLNKSNLVETDQVDFQRKNNMDSRERNIDFRRRRFIFEEELGMSAETYRSSNKNYGNPGNNYRPSKRN